MTTWKDNEGRPWTFSVNMWTCKQVKSETGWDLPNILNDGMEKLGQLVADKCELFSVFLVLLKDQIDKRGMTPEQFGMAVAGDALACAAESFLEALADFFPARQSSQIKRLITTGNQLVSALADKADEELDKIDLSTLIQRALSTQESAA